MSLYHKGNEMNIPNKWVSIDPGDRHVGFTMWDNVQCVGAYEYTPEETVAVLEKLLETTAPEPKPFIQAIVFERFQLYAWNEQSLAGNEFKTSQLIGVIKYLAHRSRVDAIGQFASQGKLTYKRAPFKYWKPRQWVSYGKGPHAKDAEAHGYQFLNTRGYQPAS